MAYIVWQNPERCLYLGHGCMAHVCFLFHKLWCLHVRKECAHNYSTVAVTQSEDGLYSVQGLRQTDILGSLTVCNASFLTQAHARPRRTVELLHVKVQLLHCCRARPV